MKTKLFLVILFLDLFSIEGFSGNLYYPLSYSALPNYYYKTPSYPTEINSISPNFRVFPSSYFQIETSITIHPINPLVMLGSAITGDTNNPALMGYTTGAYVTTNGGISWFGTDVIKDASNNIIQTFGDPTVIIDKNGTFILPYIAISPLYGVGVSYSTNNGINWSQTVYISGVDAADKVVSSTDNILSSPYYGRSYIIYSEGNIGIYFSYTTNSGINWTTARKISPFYNDARTGTNIAIGPSGNIYVTWPFLDTLTDNGYIGFAKSTNGGDNWTSKDNVIPVYPTDDSSYIFFFNNEIVNGLPVIAVDNSGGSRNGWIYVASSERGGLNSAAIDDCDLILHRSTNEGTTWESQSHRVNQDNTGSLKYQFFPALNIDKYGGINIVYYDTRDTPTNDSCNVYLSRSIDGGNTFQDILISEHKFKPKPIPNLYGLSFYAGSYIGVTSGNNKIWPLWYDDHIGTYQAWTSSIGIASIADIKVIPQGFYNITTQKLHSRDSIKVYLRNAISPYSKIDSAIGILDSITFTVNVTFRNANLGNYYLEIKHRNLIETWSKNPVSYSTVSNLIYDFTSSASKAYGDNMIQVDNSPLRFAIYSGDVNQDRIIDLGDLSLVYNAAANSISGYVPEDCNGDYFVDVSDLSIVYNNSINVIEANTP